MYKSINDINFYEIICTRIIFFGHKESISYEKIVHKDACITNLYVYDAKKMYFYLSSYNKLAG